jgi:hypothetical protein
MPKRELRHPHQVEQWLHNWSQKLTRPASLILIGSAALLWHAYQKGITAPLPENSMDADPITHDEELLTLCYDAIIGSPFELEHGWHINLMPREALDHLPADWPARASHKQYGLLALTVPAPEDLLVPKLKRAEPRDLAHHRWAQQHHLIP